VAFALESGLAVACIGVITNPATGIERATPGHDEVLAQAARASATVARLIRQLIVL
jgi:purine nucleoside phosphorylase